ncbi:MAG TPA: isopentenyl transferase family protein, partial [Puia sp.]|nr:isopentenyl transferase family protein [Puia sp.]
MELATHFNTSIISADSRQCFRELNIGVAKPSPGQLSAIRHYFINSHSILEEVNASIFESLALSWCEEIFSVHETVIMCGGTGLYIKAFREGLDEIP